ncbi:alanine racemase [Methylocapsa aurea]|uniref:alanine racemase n=1 Tax=Methylocapsa aurea TaxID=663610 RepID=UPI00056BC01B|nr:alanine racemase [Methylocapsa aurea]
MDRTTEVTSSEAGTILTVDLAAIVANWQTLRVVCGDAECGAVVKADAYGLGLRPVVKALYEAGCKTFFVAHAFEGRAARAIAPDAAIFVLNGMRPDTAPLFADFDLAPVLCSVPEIEDWGQYCAVTGRRAPKGGLLPAAFRLETGLNQLGLKPYDLEHGIHLSHLFDVKLVMTQLARAEHEAMIAKQIEKFEIMRTRLPNARASIANSGAIFLEANPLYDVVRPGYALYGGNPAPGRPNPMKPVIRLESQVIQVRILEPGERVGDDQGWAARGPRRISTISAGTADGIPQSLTKTKNGAGGVAIVQGKRCPYIGGVGMDLVAVDTSDSGYVERGDIVELIGPSITIDDFAAAAGISGYEVLTRLGQRCHRRYQKL